MTTPVVGSIRSLSDRYSGPVLLPDCKAMFVAHNTTEVLQFAHALDALLALSEIQEKLRTQAKYGTGLDTPEKMLDWARDVVLETMQDHGIDLDTLLP